MSYYLVPSLVQLRTEVNTLFPHRDKSSDGWIGDTSHAARVSSHNPDWGHGGAVRAIDVDVDDGDPGRDLVAQLLRATIGDPRIWYVISNRVIYSRTYGWAPRSYTGTDPHTGHVHISVTENPALWTDTSRWFDPGKRRIVAKPVSLSGVQEQFRNALLHKPVRFRNGVGRIQRALNHEYGLHLSVDGMVGVATLNAWGVHERRVGGTARVRVPDAKSLAALARGRFRVID